MTDKKKTNGSVMIEVLNKILEDPNATKQAKDLSSFILEDVDMETVKHNRLTAFLWIAQRILESNLDALSYINMSIASKLLVEDILLETDNSVRSTKKASMN